MNARLGLAESHRAEVLPLQIQRTGGAGHKEINTRFAAGNPCVRSIKAFLIRPFCLSGWERLPEKPKTCFSGSL